jgi:hypothetical protein
MRLENLVFIKCLAWFMPPNTSDNSFFVKQDDGNYNTWRIENVTSAGYEWRVLTEGGGMANVDLNLDAGTHMLEVRQREDGTNISLVVFTQNRDFTGYGIYGAPEVTLSYDISAIVGVPATFEVNLQEYDMFSYKLSRPRIVSDSNIAVQNIKPYLNGQYNPQHSTFTIVDKVATPDDNILSPYSLILLKENGADNDKLAFTFMVLEVSN